MKQPIIAAGFSLLSFALPFGATAASFSKVYVFGDSLSDPGNVFKATTLANQIPGLGDILNLPGSIPPSPPYYEGRYSNGLIWTDYLVEDLGLTLTPSTDLSFLSPRLPIPSPIAITPDGISVSPYFNGTTTTQSVNFAFAGAQTGFTGAGDFGEFLPGVLTQVEWFTDDLDEQFADPNALYIVWGGANDYQTVDATDAPNPEVSVGNLKTAVESLFNVGARNFLVPNLPDLGKTAQALTLGAEISSNLTDLTNTHNFTLATTLEDLSQSLTGINLVPLDVYSLFNTAIANPTAFGFTNVTQACLDPVTLIPCTNPNEYLFWDGIHPTTVTHEQLSEFALEALMVEAAPVVALPSEPVSQPQAFATLRFQAAPVAALESEPESESIPEPTSLLSLGVLGVAWLLWARFNS